MNLLAPLSSKIILGLGVALVASLGGNFLLVRHMWIEAGEAKGEEQRKTLAAQVDGYKLTEAVNTALSKRAKEDHTKLVADLGEIADEAATDRERARKVTRANPRPKVCVPGEARMNSVNKTLGPQ